MYTHVSIQNPDPLRRCPRMGVRPALRSIDRSRDRSLDGDLLLDTRAFDLPGDLLLLDPSSDPSTADPAGELDRDPW